MDQEKTFPSCTKNLSDNSILISSEDDTCSLIFLPGFDQTSQTNKELFILPESPSFHQVRTIILEPPLRQISFLDKQQKNNWFNIRQKHQNLGKLPCEQIFDFDDIQKSKKTIYEYIQKQLKYWKDRSSSSSENRVFVAGFSHGGIVSLSYGLQNSQSLVGVACFGGFLLPSIKVDENSSSLCQYLLVHGGKDQLFEQSLAKQSYGQLLKNVNVIYKGIPDMEHRFTRKQVGILNEWIQQIRKKRSI